MKRAHPLILAVGALALLGGCATQEEVADLRYEIRNVNKKVENVKVNSVDQMRQRQASSSTQLDELHEEVARLRTQIEENAQRSSQVSELSKETEAGIRGTFHESQIALEGRIAALEQRFEQLERSLSTMQSARLQDAQKRVEDTRRQVSEIKRQPPPPSPPPPTVTPAQLINVTPDSRKVKVASTAPVADKPAATVTAVEPPRPKTAAPVPAVKAAPATPATPVAGSGDAFEQARASFGSGEYKDAYDLFEKYLSANSSGPKAAETHYMMGECLFKQNDFDLAILDYQKVITNYAKSDLAPSALLKQGMSFEKLTDYETAKIIYQKLISEYGGSAQVATAKQRLGNL